MEGIFYHYHAVIEGGSPFHYVASVAGALTGYCGFVGVGKARFYPNLLALTGNIPKSLKVDYVWVEGRGFDLGVKLGYEPYFAAAFIYRVAPYPGIAPFDFAARAAKAWRTLAAAPSTGAAVETVTFLAVRFSAT